MRKRTRLSFVEQESVFEQGVSVRGVAEKAMQAAGIAENERANRACGDAGTRGL